MSPFSTARSESSSSLSTVPDPLASFCAASLFPTAQWLEPVRDPFADVVVWFGVGKHGASSSWYPLESLLKEGCGSRTKCLARPA